MNDTDASSSIQERPSPSGHTSPRGPGRPSSLDDYEIIREIGRGGTAIVYEAYHKSLRRKVALKKLPSAAALDRRWLERFRNEFSVAAQLNHPNIVPCYDLCSHEGSLFCTMQLIDGISLAEVIRGLRQCREGDPPCNTLEGNSVHPAFLKFCERCRCRFACRDVTDESNETTADLSASREYRRAVVELMRDAALAVQYAHDQSVLHLDIKPSNLLIDNEGKVWVTDFGVPFSRPSVSTHSTCRHGTAGYMSPERLVQTNETSDERSDVYSLGATLRALLMLEEASVDTSYKDASTSTFEQWASSPRKLGCSSSPDLETVIRTATKKEPNQRYATASEFAGVLEQHLDCQTTCALRGKLAGRESSSRRLWKGLANIVFTVLLVGWCGLMWNNLNGRNRPLEKAIDNGASVQRRAGFSYAKFGDQKGLQLVGDCYVTSRCDLRLTPALKHNIGAAWHEERQYVSEGFETTFVFRVSKAPGNLDEQDGAPGFAFVIQDHDVDSLGENLGDGLGYAGIPSSIAIEFDTFRDVERNDPSDCHVSVHSRGPSANSSDNLYSLGYFNSTDWRFDDGQLHTTKVRYVDGSLSIYLDDMTTPVLTRSMKLRASLSLRDGRAWVGFTAATSDKFKNHDILSWDFRVLGDID